MSIKQCIIIQCDSALKRCCGFACMDSFYNKEGKFGDYGNNMKYITFSCGGCCGKAVAGKLEHFLMKMRKKTDLKKEEIVIHLATCMVSENHHSDRCPYIDYIKDIIAKKGFENTVEGTYISKTAEKKRETGEYKGYF